MRNIVYIGRVGCASCTKLRTDVIEPLKDLYPMNVSIHNDYDEKIVAVNERKKIDLVPLIVIENNGVEEFRYNGYMNLNDLEDIILCEMDTLTLDEVLA